MNFTIIYHVARKKLGISPSEYIIADSIYHLSANPKSGGWCNASKKYLSKFAVISERAAFKAINTLLSKKIIEKSDLGLRTTETWYNTVVESAESSVVESAMNKVHRGYEQSSESTMNKVHSDTIYDNNKDNNKDKVISDSSLQDYVDKWNVFAIINKVKPIREISGKRSQIFRQRLNEPNFNFDEILRKSVENKWMIKQSWFGLDWIIKERDNYLKILEYVNKDEEDNVDGNIYGELGKN